MDYIVYMLYSERLEKFYVGHTNDVLKRLTDHNSGKGNFTSKGIPWNIVHTIPRSTKAEAVQLELQIKKRGIKRYLNDIGINSDFGT